MLLDRKDRDQLLDLTAKLTAIAAASHDGVAIDAMCDRIGLSTDLVRHVLAGLSVYGRKDNGRDKWLAAIYRNAYGRESTDPAQLARLLDCLAAIPSWDGYAALIARHSGQWPQEPARPGRPDDAGHAVPSQNAEPSNATVESALSFLRDPSRRNYIRYGQSDLDQNFTVHTCGVLNGMAVFVTADLDRFDERSLIMALDGQPGAMQETCSHRARKLNGRS